MTLDDAYDVQRRWAKARLAAGAKIIGRKIGLTSRAMQQASKMTEPDYGVMLDDALFADGVRIPAGRFIKPRLEVELAFVMGQDLIGAGCQVHDVLRATKFVQPAVEVIDDRTEVPRQIVDTIADNAAFGAIVLGGGRSGTSMSIFAGSVRPFRRMAPSKIRACQPPSWAIPPPVWPGL